MERPRREKKSKVDTSALNALSNAKRGVVSRKDQVKVWLAKSQLAVTYRMMSRCVNGVCRLLPVMLDDAAG